MAMVLPSGVKPTAQIGPDLALMVNLGSGPGSTAGAATNPEPDG